LFCSHIDFNHLISLVDKWNTKKELKFHSNHNRKLHNLGLRFSYKSLSPDDVIFNLTKKVLSDDQKNALSLGLKFCFNSMKLDYTRYFLAFENLFRKLDSCKILQVFPDSKTYFKSNLKTIALKYFYSFKPKISQYHRKLVESLKQLSFDKSIIITKPDKGSGVVLLDKSEYIEKWKIF